MEKRFIVDIPQEGSNEWVSIKRFKTKQEAIKYAQEEWGADEQGMISLISEVG